MTLSKKALIDLQLRARQSPGSLTAEEQATLRKYAPPDTLEVKEGGPAAPSPEELLISALAQWDKIESPEDLEDLLKGGYPAAPLEEIREAVRQAGIKKRLEFKVPVSTSMEPGGVEVTRYYCNAPQGGIYLLTKKAQQGAPPREAVEHILTYSLWDATKHINPLDSAEVTYTLVFKHRSNPKAAIPYQEALLADITNDLVNNQAGMLDSRRRVHAAVSALIDHMETHDLVKVKASIPCTGFFEDPEGRLYHNEHRDLQVTRPKYSKVKTRRALEALHEVLRFFAIGGRVEEPGAVDHALVALYFIVVGPLSAIRKQRGPEVKILLLHGVPHTGKTILEKLSSRIWGLPENKTVIGAAKLTPPQLATHISMTTYPLAFDEVRNALASPGIADLLKSSTTSLLVKERIRVREGFRKQSFYAYAPVIMSTNFLPDLYAGLHERLIPVEFTVRHKRSEKEAKDFDKYFQEYREDLAHIGAALERLFMKRWDRVRDLALQADQVKAGYEILSLLYLEEGLPAPVWLREVTARSELEEPDPVRIICDFMREDFMRILRQHCRPENIPLDWDQRLNDLKAKNLLPSYVLNISPKRITLSSGILREVARKGHELPGGLQGLQEYINACPEQTTKGVCDTYKKQKAVSMQREVFYAYSAAIDYQDELRNK